MAVVASSALVGAESLLALTPVVIKQTPVDHITAIWSRLLSSSILGYFLTTDHTLPQQEWAGAAALGYTNLLHIVTSYESFRHLSSGQAMSLLYTHPVWALCMDTWLSGSSLNWWELFYMGLASAGALLVHVRPNESILRPTSSHDGTRFFWGIFTGLLMAITEAGITVLLSLMNWKDPAKGVWVMSGSSSLWYLLSVSIYTMFHGFIYPKSTGTANETIWLTIFNSIALFGGYWLRSYAVTRLSVVAYSILSYSGLLASFLFGFLFLKERPGISSIFGILLILVSTYLLKDSFFTEIEKKAEEKADVMM
jgi:drug/metabolite transporter (DMT)-like permease